MSVVLALAGWLAAAEASPPTPAGQVAGPVARPVEGPIEAGRRIAVTVGGLRSRAGALRVKLVSDGPGFPGSDEHVAAKRRVPIEGDPVRVAFDGVAPGDYAVVALHDEDDDAELDTFLGFPDEGLGFSNGARIRFGPPSFDDARFALGAGADAEIAIQMQYR